ncbi:MAG: response regulator transcription factor [Gammaproteobacteria bacterium]|jgi:DNA-binding NarL/FixJ family response regulator
MTAKKKIFIVEDHQLFREGLKAMLARNAAYEVVGESADGHEALRHIQKIKPDLVLLDLTLPIINGYSVLQEIRRAFGPGIKVLVLSIHNTDQYVLQAFQQGADGYCVKDASFEEFRLAVQSVLEGKRYISPGIADQVLEGYVQHRRRLKSKSTWDSITAREKEVLKLIGEGFSNKQIAKVLRISIKTVEKHRSSLMTKLDMHNAAALATYAVKKGLIATDENREGSEN